MFHFDINLHKVGGGKKEECTTGAKMSIALETLADIISSNPARNKKIYSSNE